MASDLKTGALAQAASGAPSHVIVDSGTVDVSDRAARLLGHVTVDNATLAVTQSGAPWVTTGTVDVTDRLLRALGAAVIWDGATIAEVSVVVPDSSAGGLVTRAIEASTPSASGPLSGVGSLTFGVPNGEGTWNIQGNIANAGNTYIFEGSVDGAVFFQLPYVYSTPSSPWTALSFSALAFITGDVNVLVNIAGYTVIRIHKTSHTAGTDTWLSDFIRQPMISLVTAPQNGLEIQGSLAHDAVNTLDTVQVGGNAQNPDTPPTAVSAQGDRARLWVDKYGVAIIRQRKVRETYVATYRKAEAAGRLELIAATAANTTKQLVTLHHAATSVKELQVFLVRLWVNSVDVATQGLFEIRKINTAPATGNPAITPGAYKDNAAATEAIALALPTTQGTEVNVNTPFGSPQLWDWAITAPFPTTNPIPLKPAIELYNFDEASDSAAPLTLRAGQLQGIAIVARTVLAVTNLYFWAEIIYAEEML